jgi:hypothetical protein
MKHYLADLSTAFPDFWVEVSWALWRWWEKRGG